MSPGIGRALIPAAAALLLVLPAAARPDDGVTFGGYIKVFSILLLPPTVAWGETVLDQPDMGAVNNRLRLKLGFDPADWLAIDCEYDISPRIQDTRLFSEGLFAPGTALGGYRLTDLRARLYPGPDRAPESFAIFQNLDRLMVTVKTGAADIIVGRQPIAWGNARVVNPTDVLAPFVFNELDKEERTGVDALRVRFPLGAMDELDLGVVAGDRFRTRTSAFFVRGKTRAFGTDLAAMAMAFRDNLLLGVDLARSIGGAGAWLEAAFVMPEALLRNGTSEDEDYVRASIGLDYNFGPKTYGFVEYHFSSAGRKDPEDYLASLATTPFEDGAVYLLGRHYVSLGATYQISPLLPFTGLVIANVGDPSFILAPSVDYNISENIYFGGGAYVGVGRRPEITGILPDPALLPGLLRSEFGTYPDMIFVSFRIYF